MKSIKIFVILTLLSLSAIPALAALTDYQQGVSDGLAAGMRVGKLLGAAPFDPNLAQQYNSQVDAFNQGLAVVFGNNQTAINKFWMKPYGAAAAAAATITGKPVHSIDGSWNNTSRVLGIRMKARESMTCRRHLITPGSVLCLLAYLVT